MGRRRRQDDNSPRPRDRDFGLVQRADASDDPFKSGHLDFSDPANSSENRAAYRTSVSRR
jgi:hypothetical protein